MRQPEQIQESARDPQKFTNSKTRRRSPGSTSKANDSAVNQVSFVEPHSEHAVRANRPKMPMYTPLQLVSGRSSGAAACRQGARPTRLALKGEVCAADAERSEAPLNVRLGVRPKGQRERAPKVRPIQATQWPASKLARAVGACSDLRLPVSASLEIELHTTAPRHIAIGKAKCAPMNGTSVQGFAPAPAW